MYSNLQILKLDTWDKFFSKKEKKYNVLSTFLIGKSFVKFDFLPTLY